MHFLTKRHLVPHRGWNGTNIIGPIHQLMEVKVLRKLREMRVMYADAAIIRSCVTQMTA